MNDSIYKSTYVKTEYTGSIHLQNNKIGETEEKHIKRTVYQNSNIDPVLIIPAGTKIGNEITHKTMTNLERMQSGKSPVILTTDTQGNSVYDKIELHHLTSTECNRGSAFFNSEHSEGAIVEIQSSLHNKYKKQLHAINIKNNSFRKSKITSVDTDGRKIRFRVKTVDAEQYEKFRMKYWKDRADGFIRQKNEKTNDNNSDNQEGGDQMGKSWELTPEQKKKAIDGNKKAAAKYNKKSTTTSGTGETKGPRERDRGKSRGPSR